MRPLGVCPPGDCGDGRLSAIALATAGPARHRLGELGTRSLKWVFRGSEKSLRLSLGDRWVVTGQSRSIQAITGYYSQKRNPGASLFAVTLEGRPPFGYPSKATCGSTVGQT
jgi:hypothetical protein